MDDEINRVDVTQRAKDAGWVLPPFWTIYAAISPDYDTRPEEFDCYTRGQIAAWKNDEWQFVNVSVWVEDADSREWGHDSLGGTEHGTFVLTDEDDNVVGETEIDALADKAGERSVIREYDMIRNALTEAVKALEEFGTPVITEPPGITETGL